MEIKYKDYRVTVTPGGESYTLTRERTIQKGDMAGKKWKELLGYFNNMEGIVRRICKVEADCNCRDTLGSWLEADKEESASLKKALEVV